MAPNNWLEIPVFIHGITPDENPGSHESQYTILFKNIQSELDKLNKPKFTTDPIKIEWGWRDPGSKSDVKDDQYLAEVERLVAQQALALESGIWDFSLNPARLIHRELRKVFLFGFSDLIYYVSMDGEETIRQHVFHDIVKGIKKHAQVQKKVSLTIIGHSAGSLIAHDLLYHLFGEGKVSQFNEVRDLRMLADEESPRLRVRRLYTMGSPITPLTFRSNTLIKKSLKNTPLKLSDLGFKPDKTLSNPRWINFWDKDDIASFPVSFLYDNQNVVKDEYMDIGDFFPNVHNAYWENNKVAKRIAETI